MGKTTAEWRSIFRQKNARRSLVKGNQRRLNRDMGRLLAAKAWFGDTKKKGTSSDDSE